MAWKPPYATLKEMRDWLRIRKLDDVEDDDVLSRKISAASRAVDGTCRRQFGKVDAAVTRSYAVRWSRVYNAYVAEIDDIMDTTGLAVTSNGTAIASTDYRLRPRNAIADGKPYTYMLIDVSITGDLDMLALWGWNPPWPDEVTEATLLQASRLNIRRDSPYGIAGGLDGSAQLRLLARLDPDVAPIVAGVVRTGWVAR